MTDFLTIAGQTGTCKARSLTTLEEGAFRRYITEETGIASSTTGGRITITPSSTDFYAASTATSRLRVGDDVLIPGIYLTNNEPRVYRVSSQASGTADTYGATFYAFPWSQTGTSGYLSAATIGTAIPAGTKLAIVSRSEGIGSASPRGLTNGLLSRTHKTRIIRARVSFEGGQQALARYADNMQGVDWTSQLGRAILDAKRDMDLNWDGAIFFGEANDNATYQVFTSNYGGSNAVPSFNGIRAWLEIAGGKLNYSTNFTFDDLYNVKPMLQAAGVHGGDVLFGVGSGLGLQLEKAGLEFTREFSKSDLMKTFDELGVIYKSFTANGIRFLFHEFPTFANPQGRGVDSSLTDTGFIMPLEDVTVTADGKKISLPHVALLDYNNNGEDRGLIIGNIGGMNGLGYPIVNEYDGVDNMMLGEKMLVVTGADKMLYVQKA